MAQVPYRANLSSAVFPMSLQKAGRTVIVPGADQNFDRRVDPSGEQKDAGIPQAIYMENVLPTPNGYQSVGFKPIGTGLGFTIPGGAHVRALVKVGLGLAVTDYILVFFSNGTAQYSIAGSQTWNSLTLSGTFATPTNEESISTALVKGESFLFFNGNLYEFTVGTLTNVNGSVTGITIGSMAGICSSYNYLLIHDNVSVYWSSTTTTLDFAPSLVSGSGSETPSQCTFISRMLPHPSGFFLYSTTNVVSVTYTGNRSYPWKFREIANSGAFPRIEDSTRATTNSEFHVGISSGSQIQIINPNGAEPVLPEITDYLERNTVHDDFNSSTNVFTQVKDTQVSGGLIKSRRMVNYMLDRYLIISYLDVHTSTANYVYKYAFVYDYLLKRIGKIKFDHSFIYESEFDGKLVFINADTGAVRQLYFDIYDQDTTNGTTALRYQHSGVLVLGKFQLNRSEFLTLEEIAVESSQNTSLISPQIFSVIVLPSLKGKQFEAAQTPTRRADESEENLEVYNCHITAKNISVGIKGAFDVNTLQLDVVSGGDW